MSFAWLLFTPVPGSTRTSCLQNLGRKSSSHCLNCVVSRSIHHVDVCSVDVPYIESDAISSFGDVTATSLDVYTCCFRANYGWTPKALRAVRMSELASIRIMSVKKQKAVTFQQHRSGRAVNAVQTLLHTAFGVAFGLECVSSQWWSRAD